MYKLTQKSGRALREISFDPNFKIGRFQAFDYFGDGSFYLLDVPGHAIGHMCGLSRTTANTFVLLGADTCHFAGALRPSAFIPLPDELASEKFGLDSYFPCLCPCSLLGDCHPGITEAKKRTTAYYTVSRTPGSAYANPTVANESIRGMMEFDASDDILVCIAHDPSLFEVLPLINTSSTNNINDWKTKNYKMRTRWRFLIELPRDGKPGRKPIIFGFWRDGKEVSITEAMAK
jgi:glyoxylase-like metal-dependent hydrolase (beta-lactamase superfamily II)